MPRNPKYLLDRDGRYFARIVIPEALRPFLDNKRELREPLGPDRRTALARLHTAVAGLQAKIATAERVMQISNGETAVKGRYPLSADQIAFRNYSERLSFDAELRNNFRYASVGIDDRLVAMLRAGMAGKLDDAALESLVGRRIEHFRHLGNTSADRGTDEWRILARALCISELEALGRAMERDEGDFTGIPEHPMLAAAANEEVAVAADPTEFNQLTFEEIITEQERITGMGLGGNEKAPRTLEKYRRIMGEFDKFRRSKKVAVITLQIAEAWRDGLLASGKQSRKTVLDKLAAIRAVLTWGQKQSRGKLFPAGMPLEYLELPVKEARDSADRTYTLDQARAVLKAARGETRTAFRWVPWLLAYSGMRIGEAMQLERKDFFQVEDHWFFHVRVGNGRTTKTGKGRKIPVHAALVDEGLVEFVKTAAAGALFPNGWDEQHIRRWIKNTVLKGETHIPPAHHGFRHLFEDGLFGGVNQKAALYITGRSSGTSADDYGGSDWKLLELAKQMNKVKRFL